MNTAENQVIRLTLPAKLDFLPGATALVREVTSKLGMEDKDTRRLELVVEEACVNVIENAFEDEIGNFDISVLRRPGQIVISVEDRGLPLDIKKLEGDQESGLGVVLMKAFADEVHYLNLGRQGKRVELVKNLPEKDMSNLLKEAEKSSQAAKAALISEEDIAVRLMNPDESPSLARCAYRCYGYTYSTDNFYFPERVKEMVAGGVMISCVAVTPNKEIIGHVAVVKESSDALVGEIGQAIIDPRFRGNGILKKMGLLLNHHNRDNAMFGTYSETVTVHPFSQKAVISGGGTEIGLLLGYTPATMFFKGIQGDSNQKRRSALLFYTRMNEEPFRDIYLPAHHASMLHRIYEKSGMLRNIVTGEMPELPEHSQINVKVQTEASRAFLQVVEYGQDLDDLVKFRLKELCQRRVDCIYLDLPLSSPAVQRYCASMEMLGFFFGGILPELSLSDGDVLRLQYVNNAELELENVQIASDFGKELFQYVLKASGLTGPLM
jgi:anti-sigma regulatory factor (Ser/Thr protein kinase)